MISVKTRLIAVFVLSATVATACGGEIRYTITDLGVLNGAPSNGGSHPTALNNLGQVVGYGDTYTFYSHAFLYAGSGSLVNLGSLGGDRSVSVATAINDNGTVVGHSDSEGPEVAFAYTPGTGMQAIPSLGGGGSEALSVNGSGEIAGISQTASGAYDGFLYSPGSPIVDLGQYQARLVNDLNLVVAVTGAYPNHETFISDGGAGPWKNIGSLGGTETIPYGTNARGDVVGFSTTDSSGTSASAFLYSGGSTTNLGTLGGRNSGANGINNYGVVVGYSLLPGDTVAHAFIYDGSGPIEDLNNLTDPTLGWMLDGGMAINNKGQIAVEARYKNGPLHAILLTPVPEPPSLYVLLAAAILFLATAGARLLDCRRLCSLKRFRKQLQLSGGSDHVRTSMVGECSGAALGYRRAAVRKAKGPFHSPRGQTPPTRGSILASPPLRKYGAATVVDGHRADMEPAGRRS